jgi:hypothetical protein
MILSLSQRMRSQPEARSPTRLLVTGSKLEQGESQDRCLICLRVFGKAFCGGTCK